MRDGAQGTGETQSNDVRRLPDSLTVQAAHLRVPDLERSLEFYQGLLGLVELHSSGASSTLGPVGSSTPLLQLTEDVQATPRARRSPGLFHLALLYPTRKDLAAAFKHLYVQRWPFQGFAHHGVSEALYLADPDGNGIELYRDLPRGAWPYKNGELQMVTDPLDLEDLLSELSGNDHDDRLTSGGMSIGHIHLQVSNLQKTETFYHSLLGFDVVQRSIPGALFMSAGGYHHHFGANVWNSRGAGPLDDTGLGLTQFQLSLGSVSALNDLKNHLRSMGRVAVDTEDAFVVVDDDNIRISITP